MHLILKALVVVVPITAAATFFAFSSWPAVAVADTIDGSSNETYERSVRAMVDTLPEEDKEAFTRGLLNMILTGYPPAQSATGFAQLQFMEPAVENAYITMNGVALDDILQRGREIIVNDISTENVSANATTEPEVDPNDEVRACLREMVTISNAVIEQGSYGRTVSVDVINNLDWAIAGIRFEYTSMEDGRSVPWHSDDVSLSISGGIEPGETQTLRASAALFPNNAPATLNTTAAVLDVSDAQERQLIGDVTVIGWAEEPSSMTCG